MSKLKVHFGEPEHGWIDFCVLDAASEIVRHDVSDIYPSFDELVNALLAIYDGSKERLVLWALEPDELELHFSRRIGVDVIRLEIALFERYQYRRQKRDLNFRLMGTYNEICLPFWRALRELQSRSFSEELQEDWRWTLPFPHRELALLTEKLGKT